MEKTPLILVIEDEAPLRDAMTLYLEQAGFKVHAAINGEDGLKLALDEHPSLILLDQLMPGMNGTEVLAKIRKDEWGKHAQVVMMTNVNDLETMNDSLKAGVNDYLLKSELELEELVTLIRSKVG